MHLSSLRGLARTLLVAVFALAGVSAGAPQALATPSPIGYDLSYPQCETALPSSASFAILGVNGGLANNPNPCLAQQLTWASAASGLQQPALPGLSFYLNAADPGNGVADWPSPVAGTASAETPYGPCDGSWSRACAFSYAMQRAAYSYALALAAATPAVATVAPIAVTVPPVATTAPPATTAAPAVAPWWIDVEIGASWAGRSSSREWAQLNVAALRGDVAGLRAAGARGPVGMYSNAYQWHTITGLGPRASRAYFPLGEHDWVTGSSTLAQARRACAKPFSGSAVTIAQFSEGVYDRDYACPPLPSRARSRRR
ncbi:MAG TPA: hypothetical protein VN892_13210 [Solirubrobacteraceae bacterium]|nr:hypothetical protein [Solirubrobacteraceae bacterium]